MGIRATPPSRSEEILKGPGDNNLGHTACTLHAIITKTRALTAGRYCPVVLVSDCFAMAIDLSTQL